MNPLDPQPDKANWYVQTHKLMSAGHYEEAVVCLEKEIELNPDNLTARNEKAYCLIYLRKYEEAFQCFSRLIEIEPQNPTHYSGKAASLMFLKQYGEALKCIDSALNVAPDSADSWKLKGCILYAMCCNDAAILCFDKALGLSFIDDAELWRMKAIAEKSAGHPEKAIESYHKYYNALRSFESNDPTRCDHMRIKDIKNSVSPSKPRKKRWMPWL